MGKEAKQGDELAAELKKAAEELVFLSETDAPLEVVRLGPAGEVSADVLRKLSGRGREAPVRRQTVEEFFRAAADEAEWKSPEELESARRYGALMRLLKSKLTGVKVYRVGEPDIDAYVLGRDAGGELLGLKTKLVET